MYIYKTTCSINNKFYIGKRAKKDPGYLGSGSLLFNAIEKYGRVNFKREILEVCNSLEELDEREKYWIKKLDATNRKIAYNITEGGTGGDTISTHPNRDAIVKNLSEKFSGKMNPMYGKSGDNSPIKGRTHSIDELDKMSVNHPNSTKVIDLESSKIYNSFRSAARDTNVPHTVIKKFCEGRTKPYHNKLWKFEIYKSNETIDNMV